MPPSRRWLAWVVLFAAIAVIDLTARFALPFNLQRVLIVEAVLLLVAAATTLALIRRPPYPSGWRRTLQWVLVGSFVLGALRAAIWAAGQPVGRANLVIGVVAVLSLVVVCVLRRRQGRVAVQPRAGTGALPPN